jgi:ribosomal protein S18 acetylase RimI-like enzyme
MNIRTLHSNDRSHIHQILLGVGNFSPEEITVALELIDEILHQPQTTYLLRVLEDEGQVRGYVCYGPTPLTQGTYDLYWIAVDSHCHGKGYGQALMRAVEQDVFSRGGRLLLIETSSQQTYEGTIRFYNRAGYELAGRIRNFYRPNDDKLIFSKEFR